MKSKDLDIIHVSAHSVRIMCATLLELGINPKPILEQTGISPDLIEDMDLEITGKQEIVCQRLFAEATKHIPGAWFKTGQKYRLLSYGNLGLAMLCANTVHDALKICISSFQDLNYSLLSYRLLEDGANVYGIETEDDDVPDDLKAFCQERSLGSVNTMFSDMLMQPFPFISIESALASRPIWLEADEIAGVPIIFGCAKSRWIFDVQLSERRLPMANPLLETMYERLCERLVTRMNNYTGLVGRVYAILVRSGREIPSFPVVASELALSERTLH